jgi:hypothetical protein
MDMALRRCRAAGRVPVNRNAGPINANNEKVGRIVLGQQLPRLAS